MRSPEREQRIAAIISMRLQGWTLRAIGEVQTPPVTPQAICYLIKSALAKGVREPADELRAIELLRLDELLTGVYERAIAGDIAALDRVLAIGVRRARLTGLDAPPVRFASDDAVPTVRVEIIA